MKHYGMLETMSCEVIAEEQGPSCSSVKQLLNLKVIHVRFIEGKVEVVKRYLDKASKDILAIGQTLEKHTKKVVQKHYLAGNFTAKHRDELIASDNEILFWETLSYKKIYVGTIDREYVTVEEFIDGTFYKYINNNGNISQGGNDDPLTKKAECLAHFSYERSQKEVMLLDIQGCGSSFSTQKLPASS